MTRTSQRQNSALDNDPQSISEVASLPRPSPATLSTKEIESASDNDNGERPVREKLKKTSIATLPRSGVTAGSAEDTVDYDEVMASQTAGPRRRADDENLEQEIRGRPTRKRSHDDLENTDEKTEGTRRHSNTLEKDGQEGHARKRSKDIKSNTSSREIERRKTSGEDRLVEEDTQEGKEDNSMSESEGRAGTPSGQAEAMEEDQLHGVLSPRKKRSRDQVEQDHDKKQKVAATEEERARRNSEEEEKAAQAHSIEIGQKPTKKPDKKNHGDVSVGSGAEGKDDLSTTTVSKQSSGCVQGLVWPRLNRL